MTVEVYKPVLKPRPAQLGSRLLPTVRSASKVVVHTPPGKDWFAYTPMKPRMDLVIGIEDMTHPNVLSFSELEAAAIESLS